MFMWENISSARRDLGRLHARFRLAGKTFSRGNTCEILCGMVKLYETGFRLSDVPCKTEKFRGDFLRINWPLRGFSFPFLRIQEKF